MKRMILAALGGLALTIIGAIQPASSQEVYTFKSFGGWGIPAVYIFDRDLDASLPVLSSGLFPL